MAASVPSRIGQINQAGDVKAIFLKVFSGEVLTAFEKATVMMNRTLLKQVSSGKSVQWPRFGRATSEYHVPGAEILGTPVNQAEIVGTIDDALIAHAFIAKIDDAMSHYDSRSVYASEIGKKLAYDVDEFTLIEGLKGARLTAVGSELPTEIPFNGSVAFRTNDAFLMTGEGTGVTGASASVEAKIDAITDALFQTASRFDEAHAPDEGRFAVFQPREYRQLAQAVQTNGFSLTNTDYGTSGSVSGGKVFSIAGFEIVRSTLLPRTNVGTTGRYQFHGGDYSQTVALVGANQSVGMGKLYDLTVESDFDFRRRGTLYLAEMAAAFKYLRPETLLELEVTNGTVL